MDAMEDRYEILDVVARGAMATVWRARDARLGRVVAIKRPHAPGAVSTDSFVAAARSAAAVTHPNLVTIFDTGTDATGAYLVMEFVDGPTLAEMGGTTDGVATLGAEIASGLAALHAARIVHRDVRPSKILLGPTGPKLTNFGTARTLDAGDHSGGARRFDAPEVLAGSEPTQAADVYSLGAVLSWLVGQSPPDPALSAAIDQAMSDEPGARPTAATLAERLHGIAPAPITSAAISPMAASPPDDDATRLFDAAPASDDATRQFDGAPVSSEVTDSEQESPSHRRRLAALTALVAVALIAAVVLLTGDDGDVPVAGDTTTVVDPAASTTAAAGGTDAPATTEAEEPGGVFNTVRVFVTFIRDTPGEVLESSAAEEIISKVADGVS